MYDLKVFLFVHEKEDSINENDNVSALGIDTIHNMTPLHRLLMNPQVQDDGIALPNVSVEVACCVAQ